jgi:aminoglycoside 3-N-acetyltransferase I
MPEITIQRIETVEALRQLLSVFALAFESDYLVDDAYLDQMREHPSTLVLAAYIGEDIVGGLVACELLPIHGEKEMYIYDIVVHPQYQRQGVGVRLIQQLKEEAKCRGVKTVFVEAESEDVGAVAFYRSIGGEEVGVHHFNFSI